MQLTVYETDDTRVRAGYSCPCGRAAGGVPR